MRKPKVFIISGPSGAGKTTLINRLFQKKFVKDNFLRGISFTTRKKRRGEKEGRDYFFVDEKSFKDLKKKGFFLETQKVLDDFYGTPRFFLEEAKRRGKNLILCIDVKGGKYLKSKLKKDKIITIFITVPHREELLCRLKKRKENSQNIKKRISLAKKELQFLKFYDYLIVNQNIRESVKKLEEILRNGINQ
ncbi:MAG: guanylate kinase [Candidatus Omnitrophota bacterium]|nr:MAG: guanylate kinase [Candidatus Omnitrophota bacterium]RKY38861.1 MAG: guanylate kinase [Candidatus Omnitrophota bacterium]RKY45925.1 MAG: guanylate kinase [Candidatus Omnitrophota bacterium]